MGMDGRRGARRVSISPASQPNLQVTLPMPGMLASHLKIGRGSDRFLPLENGAGGRAVMEWGLAGPLRGFPVRFGCHMASTSIKAGTGAQGFEG